MLLAVRRHRPGPVPGVSRVLVAGFQREEPLRMVTHAGEAPVDTADRPLVLVDVRPTACGYQALLWALREAERRDATLLAVTVWAGDPVQPDDGLAEMEQALAAMVERAVAETGVRGRTRIGAVTSPVTVSDVAARTGAELLVVGAEDVAS